ncbi:MAG: methylated-DNA--[protein]-cysteine S-methyltransferase [Velocimicrobium sp.]
MEYIYRYHSKIGVLTLVSDGIALTGLWIKKGMYLEDSKVSEVDAKSLPVFKTTIKWLDDYFDGKEPGCMPPLKAEGTKFRKMVWDLLLEIPYGKVVTYGEIAKKIAKQMRREKMSAQAVGGAVGSNPISILIPCHRVVGINGNLTGYGGGLDVKEYLMEVEGMDMEQFHRPTK